MEQVLNPILHIELVDSSRLDINLKGDKHAVIKMIITAMEHSPEIAEAITEAAAHHSTHRIGKLYKA